MSDRDRTTDENAALRARISALSAASLRINASLDLETVLNEVVERERALRCHRHHRRCRRPPGLRHFGLHQQGKETGSVGVERDRFRQGALVEKL